MFGKKRSLVELQTRMVQKQLVKRAISNPDVLQAMGEIPRHCFVAEKYQQSAYNDGPLPIGYEQTISQPYIVAFMTEVLQLPPNKQGIVLEIGTGSGYQAAILSRLAAKVYTIERIEPLALQAQRIFHKLDIDNVEVKVADGGYGWLEHAPYDGILVTAAAPEIPAPLTAQLKNGARLVAPVGPRSRQELIRLQRNGASLIRELLVPVAFVPLLGEHGWAE